MLLAVEGGGFFSSSASGYSKGLALLLGWNNKEKSMSVTPWCKYWLVVQEEEEAEDPIFRLASLKNWVSRGCASFICFGRASAGSKSPLPPKVGPVQQQNDVVDTPVPHKNGVNRTPHDNDKNGGKSFLKSSLKKQSSDCAPVVVGYDDDMHGELSGTRYETPACIEGKKVQWTDTCGQDLAEIREFEASEISDSEDDFEGDNEQSCACVIM